MFLPICRRSNGHSGTDQLGNQLHPLLLHVAPVPVGVQGGFQAAAAQPLGASCAAPSRHRDGHERRRDAGDARVAQGRQPAEEEAEESLFVVAVRQRSEEGEPKSDGDLID